MKIHFFSLCLYAFFAFTNAQCQPNYQRYYQLTNAAELSTMSADFATAARYYDSAFNAVKKIPCANDIYNSLICDLHLKNTKQADKKIRLLLSLGMDIKRLSTMQVLPVVNYFRSSLGKRLLQDISSNKIEQAASIDTTLQSRIARLVKWYQKYRLMKDGYTVYKDSTIWADSQTGVEMLKIIKENDGLPSMYKLGIPAFDLSRPSYYILLFHQSEDMFGTIHDFSNDIVTAIKDGNMHPETAAYLLERSNSTFKFGNVVYINNVLDSANTYTDYNAKNYPSCLGMKEKLDEQSIAKFDSSRISIYLDDMKTNLRKIAFNESDTSLSGINILKGNMKETMLWNNRKDFEYACSQLK